MEYAALATTLLPAVVKIIQDAIEAAKGNDDVAIGILVGILGADEENYTLAAQVVGEAKVLREFGPRR